MHTDRQPYSSSVSYLFVLCYLSPVNTFSKTVFTNGPTNEPYEWKKTQLPFVNLIASALQIYTVSSIRVNPSGVRYSRASTKRLSIRTIRSVRTIENFHLPIVNSSITTPFPLLINTRCSVIKPETYHYNI